VQRIYSSACPTASWRLIVFARILLDSQTILHDARPASSDIFSCDPNDLLLLICRCRVSRSQFNLLTFLSFFCYLLVLAASRETGRRRGRRRKGICTLLLFVFSVPSSLSFFSSNPTLFPTCPSLIHRSFRARVFPPSFIPVWTTRLLRTSLGEFRQESYAIPTVI